MSKRNASTTTVKQLKEIQGVMTCMLEHEVTATKATMKWTGPKISQDTWNQVLAFFKWTNDEHHSESQVRLYINNRTQEWAAWAFPQEAKTGMTAKELDTDEAKAQRAQFSDTDGWLYFGTVHHHCGGSAFQSGTDQANEKNQDGLHITVGNMDQKLYDIHCRLYIGGNKFEPNMSWFWDVEATLGTIPGDLRQFLVDGLENRLARQQMCIPPPPEVQFPQQWRDNVIEIKPVVVPSRTYAGGIGYQGYQSDWRPTYFRSNKTPHNTGRDLYIARKEILDFAADPKNALATDPIAVMQQISQECPFFVEIIENLYRNDVGLDELIEYMLEQEEKEAAEEAEAALKGKSKQAEASGKTVDIPPTEEAPAHGTDYDGYNHGLGWG